MEVFGINIAENHIHINVSDLIKYISLEKQKRVQAFHDYHDAKRVLIGDIIIRSIVCRYLHKNNQEIQFNRNRYGKPYLCNTEGFHYNIAHSGKWVVCAVDSDPVGIDVEEVALIDLAIAPNLFSPAEVSYIMDRLAEERTDHFYEVWTLKESYIKALGCGLSKELRSFSLKFGDNGNISVVDSDHHVGAFLRTYELEPEYRVAVCARHDEIPDQITVVNMEWIMEGLIPQTQQVSAAGHFIPNMFNRNKLL